MDADQHRALSKLAANGSADTAERRSRQLVEDAPHFGPAYVARASAAFAIGERATGRLAVLDLVAAEDPDDAVRPKPRGYLLPSVASRKFEI